MLDGEVAGVRGRGGRQAVLDGRWLPVVLSFALTRKGLRARCYKRVLASRRC